MNDDPIDRVRSMCLALPEAIEKQAWGEPTFRIRDRIFAQYAGAHNHHGKGRAALWCPAPPGTQQMLVGAEPDRFFVPAYVGKYGWIGLHLDAVSDVELGLHVQIAYCMVAPKKLRDRLAQETV